MGGGGGGDSVDHVFMWFRTRMIMEVCHLFLNTDAQDYGSGSLTALGDKSRISKCL